MGFGNVDPPPLQEDTGSIIATRMIGRMGDMLGEEVMLTVEDFREKGAVGAVKDAVADAGDLLIDGASWMVGWVRGDPPLSDEEEDIRNEEATQVLALGPSGAAYGVAQASPTGGINAVWVMPEDADPVALAQLQLQQGGCPPAFLNQYHDPRIPKNIQPYQQLAKRTGVQSSFNGNFGQDKPIIAPYQPAVTYPPGRPSVPPPAPNLTQGNWGLGSYSTESSHLPGAVAVPRSTGARGLVERVANGEILSGPDAARRLCSQCKAGDVGSVQLGGFFAERANRAYLGLDDCDLNDADAALARLLMLLEALVATDSEFGRKVVGEVKRLAIEEFLSLRSSVKYRGDAESQLTRLGFFGTTDAAPLQLLETGPEAQSLDPEEPEDLLGDELALSASDLLSEVVPPEIHESQSLIDTGPCADALSLDPINCEPSAWGQGSISMTMGESLESLQLPSTTTIALVDETDAFAFVTKEMSKARPVA